jgi:hypothetical protein
MAKVIARIKGGLGNQLFCYAAARRLALRTGADLVIDDVTGFARDRLYRRNYALEHFSIPARKATPFERMEPCERARRGVAQLLSRYLPFENRRYLEQQGAAFDPRLLAFSPAGTVYLDGLWQSEEYFKDVEGVIRQDLVMQAPRDRDNLLLAEAIDARPSVALHVRWFDPPGAGQSNNVSGSYYRHALGLMEEQVAAAHYFVFSDDPDSVAARLELPVGRFTLVCHNRGDDNAWADLWLMSRCRHFITANSTFSWWGAWLGETTESIILTPDAVPGASITHWGFPGLIPGRWRQVPAAPPAGTLNESGSAPAPVRGE